MHNLKFKYVSARNFMCYGPEGIELNLTNYGNVVLVRGDNLDVSEEDKIASNGTGKSSIPDIFVYTLYGKTIKEKLNHGNVIHNKIGKDLRTEVRWDKYRVVRERLPNKLQIWESENEIWDDSTEITLGGMPATQKLIEEKVGLSYESFVNVLVFTDSNKDNFLECDTPTKRKIVENLLSLSKYRGYFEAAKSSKNTRKDQVNLISKDYEKILTEVSFRKSRIDEIISQEKSWRADKSKKLNEIILTIKNKRSEMEKESDVGNELALYNSAQDKIKELNDENTILNDSLTEVFAASNEADSKLTEIKTNESSVREINRILETKKKDNESNIKKNENTIKSFESKAGTECPQCLGVVEEKNFRKVVQHSTDEIQSLNLKITSIQEILLKEKSYLEKITEDKNKTTILVSSFREIIEKTNKKITSNRGEMLKLAKTQRPVVDVGLRLKEEQIESLKKQALDLKQEVSGASPYVQIVESAKVQYDDKLKESTDKSKELKDAERELPYYEFWVKAFGDSGIRKFVVDGIIPALNAKTAYWLDFLIDGKIKLTFDNQLEEKIERNPADGDPFVYYAMSGGERRRLNLAVSQAFAHVMMLNSGTSPSLVFLDEVTTNIDPIGVQGVYNMIVELSKEKQIFIVTHDRDLLDLVSGCETINLVRKDGFTRLVV